MNDTSAKIVGFRGNKAYSPSEPIDEIVEELEKILAEAKSGNVRACAVAYVICHDTSLPILHDNFYAEMGKARDLYMSLRSLVRSIERWIDE